MARLLVLLLSLPYLLLGSAAPIGVPQEAETVPDTIVTAQLHFFLVPVDDTILVAEYHVISNAGEEAYEGTALSSGRQRVLGFQLPEGATDLQFESGEMGDRYVEEEGGFALTEPIEPGEGTTTVQFSYNLPWGEGLTLAHKTETAVTSVVVIVSAQGIALESDALLYRGEMDTEMGTASYYTGGPLEAGETLAFTVVTSEAAPSSAVVAVTTPATTTDSTGSWALGIVAVAAAAAIAYYLWRPGTPMPMPESARPAVEEIARLDQSYQAGAIGEESYWDRRSALVQRLRARLERAPDR